MSCALIIPARDEEQSLPEVLHSVPGGIDRLLVVDNGSRDRTAEVARACGAEVVSQPRTGYGWACLAGVLAAPAAGIYAFCDGDGAFELADLPALVEPVRSGSADLCLGLRSTSLREPGSMPAHQGLGNRLALSLLAALYGARLEDVGPARAISGPLLRRLGLGGSRYAWQTQMTVRALRAGGRLQVIPVRHRRRRGGRSKVGGRLVPSLWAGAEILEAVVAGRLWRP